MFPSVKCVEFFGKYLNVSLFKKISVFTIWVQLIKIIREWVLSRNLNCSKKKNIFGYHQSHSSRWLFRIHLRMASFSRMRAASTEPGSFAFAARKSRWCAESGMIMIMMSEFGVRRTPPPLHGSCSPLLNTIFDAALEIKEQKRTISIEYSVPARN